MLTFRKSKRFVQNKSFKSFFRQSKAITIHGQWLTMERIETASKAVVFLFVRKKFIEFHESL